MDKLAKLNRSRGSVLVACGLVFLFLLALNWMTPYVADDYVYLYSFDNGARITDLPKLAQSMYVHCFCMNGRVVSHGLDQFFMIFPKPVFNVVNALVYAGLMYLIHRIAGFGGKGSLLLFAAICAGFWYCLPVLGQVCLWQTGSANYLWALMGLLVYLCPFLRRFLHGREPLPHLWQKLLFCGFAFLFGMYSEVPSFIGMLLAVLLLAAAAVMKKARPVSWLWLCVALAAAGFAVMMMMPAEVNAKLGGLTLSDLILNFSRSTTMLRTYCLPILLVWAVSFILGLYAKLPPERLVLSLLLAVAAVAANYMLIVAAYYPERCLCTTVMLLVTACAVLIAALCDGRFQIPCACGGAILAVVFLFSLVLGTIDIQRCYSAARYREQVIRDSRDSGVMDVVVDRVYPSTPYSPFYDLRDVATDTTDTWPNSSMAKYYGVNSILGR